MKAVDLNCDLGEGTGIARFGGDAAIFPLISSANIACGFHAGNPQLMRDSVYLALRHGVSIGAHPGTNDVEGFGRRAMNLTTEDIENLLLYQIGALDAFTRAAGGQIRHIKPHGWVYNEAAINANFAQVIARTVRSLNPGWILFGAAGSQLIAAAKAARIPVAEEAFADRTYETDGTLSSRSQPGSLITDPVQAARQCLDIVLKGKLTTASGTEISLHADTICIHGDNPSALTILRHIREEILNSGFQILPPPGI